ncbi:hypothetical protein E2C01_041465 [Portunus trituberculatus]|uniref:Uncharacterized protein n=1 Tax=Portunus trituberculatus TaxID=210409 RepID=A0A5B7FK33_PORTR|nr:hypothetical protein [Portunus trituberculatus]
MSWRVAAPCVNKETGAARGHPRKASRMKITPERRGHLTYRRLHLTLLACLPLYVKTYGPSGLYGHASPTLLACAAVPLEGCGCGDQGATAPLADGAA